jgi:hypothetical protein
VGYNNLSQQEQITENQIEKPVHQIGQKMSKKSVIPQEIDMEFSEEDDRDPDFVPESQSTSTEIPLFSALSSPLRNKIIKKTCKRIPRPCIFCSSFQTNLHRHIVLNHKSEEIVTQALALPKRDRALAFALMRKNGISKYNRTQSKKDIPSYERERSRTEDQQLVQCGNCLGFYSKDYFARHKKLCIADLAQEPRAMPIDLLAQSFSELKECFKTEILACFAKDEIGKLCKTDDMIRLFGSRMFEKLTGKTDKKAEVRRSVMSDMRRLAYLFLAFKNTCESAEVQVSSSSDMLNRKNFPYLEDAISQYTCSSVGDGLKAGLKTALNYLLKRFSKVAKASLLVRGEDEKASEIDKFLDVFQLNQNHIFGDATYKLNRNRQEKLRRPTQLPSEADIEKLKQYTLERVTTLLQDEFLLWDTHTFTELRDLAVSRLTLFNARRGGEPARLRVSEWLDAENNSWLDASRAQHMEDDVDRTLFHDMKVTFQGGKGNNHLVPVLFPLDIIPAMQKLVAIREVVGIKGGNCFMFPCTQNSDTHVSGWHAVSRISTDAGLENPERLTATKMRHRVSTIYAAMDVTDGERQHFYKHMGHSASINTHIYQAPLAEAEILHVGRRLQEMDGHYQKSNACTNGEVDGCVALPTAAHDRDIPEAGAHDVPLTSTEQATTSNGQPRTDAEMIAQEQPVNGLTDYNFSIVGPGMLQVETTNVARSRSQSRLLGGNKKAEQSATKNNTNVSGPSSIKKHGPKNSKGIGSTFVIKISVKHVV